MMDPTKKEKILLKDIRRLEKHIKDQKEGLISLQIKLENAERELRNFRGRASTTLPDGRGLSREEQRKS